MTVYDEFESGLQEAESLLAGSARGSGGRRVPGGRFRIRTSSTPARLSGPFAGVWSPFTPSKADLQDAGVRSDVSLVIVASRAQFASQPQERDTVIRVDDAAEFSIREVTADEISFTIYVTNLT